MPNLVSFLKNPSTSFDTAQDKSSGRGRKTLFFVFAFFVVAAFAVPQLAFASVLDAIGRSMFNGMVTLVLLMPLLVTSVAADAAGIILAWTLSIASAVSYTKSPAVNIGWPIVRDLANMIVVLGFVIIGISTALRVKEYEAKQLLVKLIIAALLINFSLVLCGLFIDGTNILMNFFFSNIKNAHAYARSISNSFAMVSKVFTTDWTVFAPQLLAMIMFNFIAFFIYLLYVLLLLGRVIALWILVILSPLAFVCYVFPFTKKVWQMWWSNFFQWCIIGVPAGLFYLIGSSMIKSVIDNPGSAIAPGMPSPILSSQIIPPDAIKTITGSISLLIPGLFLIIGFFVSLQFSATGASAILNFANKNKEKILGGGLGALQKAPGNVGKVLSWTGNKIGSGNVIGQTFNKASGWANKYQTGSDKLKAGLQKTRSSLGRGLETVGAQPTGAQAIADQARVEAAAKLSTAAYISNNAASKARIESLAKTGSGIERAGAIQAITGENSLHKVFIDSTGKTDINKMNEAITYATNSGAATKLRENAEKHNYELAQFNEKKIKELMDNQGITEPVAKERVVLEQLKSSLSQMSTSELGRINPKHIADYDFVKENFNPRMIDQLQVSTNPSLIAGMKAHITNMRRDKKAASRSGDKGEATKYKKMIDAINRLP
ncbi:MAG: hypothetical protein NT155_00095 [Candidatus Staskawiczbacteria bacterium]|nr:hypothetical protein [Candidatus Staskawiczbacteria bacterium]